VKKTVLFLLTASVILQTPILGLSQNKQDNFYTKDWRSVCFDSGIVAAASGALTYTALAQDKGMPYILNFLRKTKYANLAQYARPMQLITTGCVAGLAGLYTYKRLNWYTAASKRARALKIIEEAEAIVAGQERSSFSKPIDETCLVREVHKVYPYENRPLIRAFRDLASFVKGDFVERVQKLAASACQEDPTIQKMADDLVARAQLCRANSNRVLEAIYDAPEYWAELDQERADMLRDKELRAETVQAEAALVAARAQEKSAQAQEKIAQAQYEQARNAQFQVRVQPTAQIRL